MNEAPRPYPNMPAPSPTRSARRLLALAACTLLAAPIAPGRAFAAVRRGAATLGSAAARHGKAASPHRYAAAATAHPTTKNVAREQQRLASRSRAEAMNQQAALRNAAALQALESRSRRHALAAKESTALAAKESHAIVQPAHELAADRRTEERVHAWYNSHPSAAAPATPEPAPDLATAAPKATAADFDRAAAAQRLTIRSAAEQNSRQTTAADDAADAETRIPSTAPTEREPAPFTHGGSAESTPAVPANNTRRNPAPIVRQRPAAATASLASNNRAPEPSAPTLDLGAPAVAAAPAAAATGNTAAATGTTPLAPHPDLRSLSSVTRHAAAPGAVVIASAADSSPRAQRAVSSETTTTALPLQLPSPPANLSASLSHPAISAIQVGARRPALDPAVTAGMAERTFDGDVPPATPATAIRLSTAGVKPSSKALAAEDDGYPPSPAVPVNLFDGTGHLVLLPPMKGSHEILVHQNQMAVQDGLDRIQNDRQLDEMRQQKLLVALPDEDAVYPNDALPFNRRYARPWTVRFIRDIARAHYVRFGTPLVVTSAVRTVEFQRRLVRINGNAAPPTGDIASPHLYGQAIDFGKNGMSLTEITWMRAYLGPVEDEGKIDVEEEFQQACFHISVYRRYLGTRKSTPAAPAPILLQAKSEPAAPAEKKHRLPTALLATHLP